MLKMEMDLKIAPPPPCLPASSLILEPAVRQVYSSRWKYPASTPGMCQTFVSVDSFIITLYREQEYTYYYNITSYNTINNARAIFFTRFLFHIIFHFYTRFLLTTHTFRTMHKVISFYILRGVFF